VDFLTFQKSFETALGKIRLPADCKQREPNWEVVTSYFWRVEVFFDFSDQKHIRIQESYDKFAKLYMSRKTQWSYHYGDTATFDENGDAVRGAPDDPLDLRIDTDRGLHMHYQKQQPHYRQDDIEGIDLATVGAVEFIRAVLTHRRTHKSLGDVLGFKIKGT
jgi:hypothetical protein